MLSLILIVILTLLIWLRASRQRHVKIVNKIPGPSTLLWPLIGNVHQFYDTSDRVWTTSRKLADDYYPIFRLWRFGKPLISIRHPDDAEILLTSTKHINKGSAYDYLRPWLGTGLLTSSDAKWKDRKKMLLPSFHINLLNEFTIIFDNQAKNMVNFIKATGSGVLDVAPIYSKYTLNTICETALGTHLKDGSKVHEEFREALHDMGRLVYNLALHPLADIPWLIDLLPIGRLKARVLNVFHNFSMAIIRERKQYHEDNNVRDVERIAKEGTMNNFKKDEPKKHVALLDLLIQVSKRGGIDDMGIRNEVDTFIFGGLDTSAAAMVFTTLLLAENKQFQDEARSEVDKVFEKSNGKLRMEELQCLTYLEKCINESLRLYPSLPVISRVTEDDLQLRDYLVPKGTEICLMIYDLHRDPNFWPNPDEFNPDRFQSEAVKKRHRYSFLPFSAGMRNCIGKRFAMLELKSSIAHLLRHFYLEPIDKTKDIRFHVNLVIASSQPLRIKFIPRKIE